MSGSSRPLPKSGSMSLTEFDVNGEAIKPDPAIKNRNILMRASYFRSGITTAFVDKALSTSYDDMWYPSFAEMEAAKVLTRKASASEIQPPFALGLSRATLEASLLTQLLWTTAKEREPQTYELAIDSAWRHGQTGMKAELIPITAQSYLSEKLMERLATAPDDVVDGVLSLINDQIQVTRNTDAERCASLGISAVKDGEYIPEQAYLDREKELMLGIINGPVITKPLTNEQARKKILPVYFKVFKSGYAPTHESAGTPVFRCGFIATLFGNMAKMPRKDRIIAVRSMMIFGQEASKKEESDAKAE